MLDFLLGDCLLYLGNPKQLLLVLEPVVLLPILHLPQLLQLSFASPLLLLESLNPQLSLVVELNLGWVVAA